jgi:hypothetical protein
VAGDTPSCSATSSTGRSRAWCSSTAWRWPGGSRRSAATRTTASSGMGTSCSTGRPRRVRAFSRERARRTSLMARLWATRRTHASGRSYSRTCRQRASARRNASWTTSSASGRLPVTT